VQIDSLHLQTVVEEPSLDTASASLTPGTTSKPTPSATTRPTPVLCSVHTLLGRLPHTQRGDRRLFSAYYVHNVHKIRPAPHARWRHVGPSLGSTGEPSARFAPVARFWAHFICVRAHYRTPNGPISAPFRHRTYIRCPVLERPRLPRQPRCQPHGQMLDEHDAGAVESSLRIQPMSNIAFISASPIAPGPAVSSSLARSLFLARLTAR
jgi:hypothetical protein